MRADELLDQIALSASEVAKTGMAGTLQLNESSCDFIKILERKCCQRKNNSNN